MKFAAILVTFSALFEISIADEKNEDGKTKEQRKAEKAARQAEKERLGFYKYCKASPVETRPNFPMEKLFYITRKKVARFSVSCCKRTTQTFVPEASKVMFAFDLKIFSFYLFYDFLTGERTDCKLIY